MNDQGKDTHDIRKMRRDQLIEQCLQMGMPVVGDEDEETLEMYIDLADDDVDGLGLVNDDCNDDRVTNESSKVKKTSILGKFVTLFM